MDTQTKTGNLTATLICDAQDLHNALYNVALAASKDEARPVLTGIQLELEGQAIRAVATDSYRMHADVVTCSERTGDTENMTFLMPAAKNDLFTFTLKRLKAAKTYSGQLCQVTFKAGDYDHGDKVHADVVTIRPVPQEPEIVFDQPIQGEFPNWRALWPASYGRENATTVYAFNPHFLADFGKLKGIEPNTPIRLFTHHGAGDAHQKPTLIETASNFRALLMPVRLPSTEPQGSEHILGAA